MVSQQNSLNFQKRNLVKNHLFLPVLYRSSNFVFTSIRARRFFPGSFKTSLLTKFLSNNTSTEYLKASITPISSHYSYKIELCIFCVYKFFNFCCSTTFFSSIKLHFFDNTYYKTESFFESSAIHNTENKPTKYPSAFLLLTSLKETPK